MILLDTDHFPVERLEDLFDFFREWEIASFGTKARM